MRIIQIGIHGFGYNWRKTLSERKLQAVALVDANSDALTEGASYFNLQPELCFAPNGPWETIAADVVIDSSPHRFHLSHAERAFRTGKDFLCVKPLSDSWDNARQMLELADAYGRKIVVAQQLRYQPVIMTMRDIVASGVLGQIGYVHLDSKGPKPGLLGKYHTTFGDRYPALIGGSIHALDYARWVLAADATHVSGESFNPAWIRRDEQYCAYGLYTMSNGSRLCYRLMATGQVSEEDWLSEWHIEGTDGCLFFREGKLSLDGREVYVPDGDSLDIPALNARIWGEYADWKSGGPEPLISGKNNMNSVAMLYGLIRSAETGSRVSLEA